MNKIIGILLLILCAAWFSMWTGIRIGYRDGQVAALTGNVAYQLVVHPDSTKTWERIKK